MIAVLLAGGKGTRLAPFTVSLPKPLMPVGNYPILEILIRRLKASGISRFIIATGHMESLIRAYFGDGSKLGVEISYSNESEPLGTAGPLKLLKKEINEPFLFINGDTYSNIDIVDFIASHNKSKCMATIGLTKRLVNIDFGVVKLDETQKYTGWQEKPTFEYLVSMGMYVFQPEVIDYIPKGFFNVPDLIEKLREINVNINGYIHTGQWLDIGRIEDYHAACKLEEENSYAIQ
ncbi:MAG: NTP transferase domain-containing protein [Bacteroidales bacterium]|nr:NTP transferase domain-containing protein [Bacteroidales bacterium]